MSALPPVPATQPEPHHDQVAAASGSAPYRHQCAALGVKANTRLARNEAALVEQPKLDFTLNYIGGAGLRAATDAISRNKVLESLILCGNGLNNDAVVFLCRALKGNKTLAHIDLSDNPISLPAGLALIELVKDTPSLREVVLNDTLVDEPVQAKIRRLINISRVRREKAEAAVAAVTAASDGSVCSASPAAAVSLTPYQRAVKEYEAKATRRKAEAAAHRQSLEETAAIGVAEELKALGARGPERGPDGWAVLTLFVSTAPHGFTSELRLLHDVVIPRLNRQFASRKVAIVPFAMYHEVPPLGKERAKRAPPRLALLADHQDAVLKSAPLFLQFVGDSIGLSELVPQAAADADGNASSGKGNKQQQQQADAANSNNNNASGSSGTASSLPKSHVVKHRAVPHLVADGARILERELALAPDDGLRLVFRRAPSLSLGVPPAILSTVSDDPHVAHPDPHTHVVKQAVAKAQGVDVPRSLQFDYELCKHLWTRHVEYKTSLEQRLPRAFLCDYSASFDTVDELGQVLLSGLEPMEQALTRRLAAAIETLYPLPQDAAHIPAAALASKLHEDATFKAAIEKAMLQRSVAVAVGRKGIAGKLDLYTVTPPSRNMALLTCTPGAGDGGRAGPGAGASSVAAGYVVRARQKQSYIVASHFASNPWFTDQPSDLRTVLLNLARQLLGPDAELPQYIATEVDINKIKQFFNTTLSNTSGDAGDSKTVIVVLDGIDDVDPAVLPCRSLRVSDTGADEWDPPVEAKSIQKPLPAVTHRPVDTHDWIPICLSRNLRFVVTAQRDSEAHKTLELRGHDSCDALPLGEVGENDVESIVMRECEALGVFLRDEEMATIRSKADARVPEYLHFVIDYIRRREESAQYQTRLTGLTQLPGTANAMCEALLDRLEKDIGASLSRTLVSLLLASRWGLLEWELRALLRQQSQQVKEAGAKAKSATSEGIEGGAYNAPLLNGELFQRILRHLRPVLDPASEALAWTRAPFNGLHTLVHLRSRTFRAAATRRYMGDDATFLAAHHQLAHHYRRLTGVAGPLETKAVREFPYHVVKGEMWTTLESQVASLGFVAQAYLHRLGYEALRELVRAYNTLDDIATERAEAAATAAAMASTPTRSRGGAAAASGAPTTARGPTSTAANLTDEMIESLKLKLREYCYFVKHHNVNLVQYPHMVRQIAITTPVDSCLHQDARSYFKRLKRSPHFVVVNRARGKLHHQSVNAAAWAPTGLRVATCSDDRTIKICGVTGDALITVSQSVSKVTALAYSGTSRYIAAACQDRSVMVVDATNGALIARANGHTTTVRCVAVSARGRFVFSGGEDRLLKCWDSESGVELFTTSLASQSHHTSPHGAVNAILTHPTKEDVFYTMVDKKLIGWRVKSSALDEAEETVCIVGHNTLPLANAHLALDGQFAVTTARDLAMPGANASRAEDNIKLWSLETGRCLATCTLGTANPAAAGHVASALAPDEKTLAAVAFDGGLDLYSVDWRSLAPTDEAASAPVVLTPYRMLSAFREHPTPKLAFVRFSFDSSHVAAIGNLRQLKVWSTEPVAADDAAAPSGDNEGSGEGAAVGGSLLTALSAADRTVAEFLMDQPATCMDWTPAPSAEEGGELVLGDSVGKLFCLKLEAVTSKGGSNQGSSA
eukprot:CAMPEP_0174882050 /NCGR_PEP_ID=MMETSP1114-20130205/84566_1 /TAXON_ID=312471 /ORGANISM="Neobodo designis, Strain CCAP 1951/1" /LENGTH=1641 /DNA_ID=CAMNT_0016117447 /DNA_START=125 /DNA_END=5049 /DNA_ORIENTATION=+